MDNRMIAKELVKISKMLEAGQEDRGKLRDEIWSWLNNNTEFYSDTGNIAVSFRIEDRFAGDFPYQVFLGTACKDYFSGSGLGLIRDIRNCIDKLWKVEEGLRKKFPGIVVKVIE